MTEQNSPSELPAPSANPTQTRYPMVMTKKQKDALASNSPRFLPSLSKNTGGRGRPSSRYVPPGNYLYNPTSSFKFPPVEEVIKDFETCAGNLDTFIEAATPDKFYHDRFMYDLLLFLKDNPTHFEKFKDMLASGLEARRYRIQLAAIQAIEAGLAPGKATPQMIKLALESKLQPVTPIIPADKPQDKPPSSPVDDYLKMIEDDSSEEG